MSRFSVFVLLAASMVLGAEGVPSATIPDVSPVTFNKDVLPRLQENCQVCHRPNSIAPMSLTTYASVRPWAKAIKAAVLSKKMPPWFADPHVGEFRNAPKLKESDIQKLASWVDAGAPEGDSRDITPAPEWKDGWRTKPDVIVSMVEPYPVAETGVGEVRQFMIDSPFKEDTWVSAIEIRPGDPSVVHHVLVKVPEQGAAQRIVFSTSSGSASVVVCGNCPDEESEQKAALAVRQSEEQQQRETMKVAFFDGFSAGVQAQRGGSVNGGSYSDFLVRLQEQQTGKGHFTTMEAVYAPGSQPLDFGYTNSAKLIPGGKPIILEVHYTPNGKATKDQTQVGFTLAKAPAERRFVMMAPEHLVDDRKPIPAGDSNWETTGEITFDQDADLVWFMPHMHLRGKDMTFQLIHPDGRKETVLSASFDFHWQLGYEVQKPIKVEKGTRMIVTAHHDNSVNNPSNPAPGEPVAWGEMTSEEMMLPWFGVLVDRDLKPEMIASYKPGNLEGPFPGQKGSFVINRVGAIQR